MKCLFILYFSYFEVGNFQSGGLLDTGCGVSGEGSAGCSVATEIGRGGQSKAAPVAVRRPGRVPTRT